MTSKTTLPLLFFQLRASSVSVFLDLSVYILPLSQIQLIQRVYIIFFHQLISITVILPVSQAEKLASFLTYSSFLPLIIRKVCQTLKSIYSSLYLLPLPCEDLLVHMWIIAVARFVASLSLVSSHSNPLCIPLREIIPSTPFSSCHSSTQLSVMIFL